MTEKSVKTYYKDLNYLIILNFILLILILFANQFNNILNKPDVISSFIPIIIEGVALSNIPLFVKDIIPTETLMKIVFVDKYSKPLPSGRVFEKIKDDVRIDKEFLLNKYFYDTKKFPENYIESHCAWYKIYREHSNDPRAEQSQKDYLFYRDSFASTLLFIALTPIIICLNIFFKVNMSFTYLIPFYILLILELILYWYLTRIKSNAFVIGILITASHVKKEKIKKIEIYHKFE